MVSQAFIDELLDAPPGTMWTNTKNSKIIWEGVKVSLEEKEEIDEFESIGICGQPDWLQEAEIPKCPKSGKSMRFLY